MKKLTLSIVFLFFGISIAFNQNWLNSAGSLYNDESYDVEVDAAGNIYTTGYTTAQSTFGPTTTVQTNGFSDVYVSKSSSSGSFTWVKTFGGAQADRGYDIELDAAGNIYVTGYFQGTADFDGITLTSVGSQDIFVAKLDNNGNVLWVVSEGGNEGDTGYGITVDNQGNVIATGQFKGTATIGPNSFTSAINPNTNQPEYDIFISKYDANGNDLWSIQGSAKYDDRGLALKTDGNDNILVTGQFSDTLTIAGNTHNNTIHNAGMVLKLDPNGNEIWFKRMGAIQTLVYDLEIDSQDNVYITGDFQGQLMILNNSGPPSFLNGNYQYRIFLIKMNDIGEVIWMTADDSDSEVSSKALAMDVNGDLYLSGTFKCVMNEYADSLGEGYFNSVGFNDVFIAKYSNSGIRQWMRQYGGPYDDYCSGIAIDQIDKPIISGGYTDFFNYPQGSGFNSIQGINYQAGSGWAQNCPQSQVYGNLDARGNKDIFVGQPVDFSTNHYYYYENTTCGLTNEPCFFTTCEDSVEYCVSGDLIFISNTPNHGEYEPNIIDDTPVMHFGPYFDLLWNTGETHWQIQINQSGNYYYTASRIDGCSEYTDTIVATIHQLPNLPVLSDSTGSNSMSFPYNDITVCQDTVWTWMNNLDSGLTLTYYTSDTTFNDTLLHEFTISGNFIIKVTDTNGCYIEDDFDVAIEQPVSDTIVPYIIFEDVDSVCLGDRVDYVIADSLTNPNGNYQSFCSSAVIAPPGPCLGQYFFPTYTGWYYIQHTVVLGYDNTCGTDTENYFVEDSIYITVLPPPTASYTLDGDPLLCPGERVMIWTSDTIAGFQWSGPSIDSVNTSGDTIWVNDDGIYRYGGVLTDSIFGCSSNISVPFTVSYKIAPEIISNVPDNIICPNDSIMLTCVDPGISYLWVGPQGNTIGNTQSIWVDVPGFYHCILMDADSCILTSNSIELKEYNSPYIMADPGTELCHSGAIDLMAIYNGAPNLFWLPPINSSDSVVTVTQPGTYYMEVSQCGFTVMDSIVITSANMNAEITILSDTIMCPGDTAVLMANSGMAVYQWTPAFYGQTYVTTVAGKYVVTITDGASGCTATSDTVTISYFQGGQDPDVDPISVCFGDSAILVNENPNVTTQWFINDSISTPILTNDSLIITNITSDTLIYVENFDTSCTSLRIPVLISVNPVSLPPIVSADTSICPGTNFVLYGNVNAGGVNYTWTGPNGLSANQNSYTLVQVDSTHSGMYVLTADDGQCSNSDSILVTVLSTPNFELSQDSVLKCQLDTAQLYVDNQYQNITWSTGSNADTIHVIIPGIYYAYYTDSLGCMSPNDSILVANFQSPMTYNHDTIICVGESLVYNSIAGNSVTWYSLQDSLLSSGPTLSTAPLLGDQTYFAEAVDSNGCSYLSEYINVTVIPPNGQVPISGDSIYCFGENVNLSTSFFPGATYEWSHDGNVLSNSQIFNFHLDEWSDSGTYTLNIYGLNCYDPTNEITISILDIPSPPVVSGDTILCAGDSLLLIADTSDNSVVWTSMWGNQFGTDSLFYSYSSPSHSGTVTAYAIDSNGCSSESTTIEVMVFQNPQNPILIDQTLCAGEDLELAPLNAYGPVNFEWSDSTGVLVQNDSLIIANVDTTQNGIYILTVTDNHGCSSSDSVSVLVINYPEVELGADSLTVCVEDLNTFELEIADNYDSYEWQDGSTYYYFDVADSGYYYVTAGIGNCFASDSIYITLDTCTINYIAPNVITPNGDGVNDLFLFDFEYRKVTIFDRWGIVVFESAEPNLFWDGRDQQGRLVSEGVYFYVIEAEEQVRGHLQVFH